MNKEPLVGRRFKILTAPLTSNNITGSTYRQQNKQTNKKAAPFKLQRE